MTDAPPAESRRSGPRVMISCGEASGDLYASALADALRARNPDVTLFGFGGPRLAAAHVNLVGDYAGVSVTGLFEAASVLSRSWRMLGRLREAARTRRPDVFVAVDFPDFNFRLLPYLQTLGIPVVYYVSPQLWAWRAGRMATLRKFVRQMLVIFPFEAAIYEQAGVPVEFVGHPLVELALPTRPRDEWLRSAGLDSARPLVALLPGSRPNEVAQILPILAGALERVRIAVPGTQFVVARAPGLSDELFTAVSGPNAARQEVTVVTNATDDVLAAADLVLTASGTATVQAALHGKPMVIVYRLSPLTYAVGRAFVRVRTYGMVNLVAGREVVPELIQGRFTVASVAAEAISLLTDGQRREAMRRDVAAVRTALGGPGASARAAEAVLRVAARAGGSAT